MSLLNQSGGDYYVCNDYGIIFDKYCDFTTYKHGIWFPSSDYTESTPPSQRTYDRFFISDGIPYITSEVALENGDNIHNNICCDLNYSTFFKSQSNGIDTVANKSYWSSDYGLYTNNSDIAGVRNIFFYEISSSTTDGGLLFKKSSGWDKFWIRDGVGYIGINYTDSNNPTGTYTLLSTGNYSNYVVPTTRTVNGKALSSNISLTAADVGAVPTSRKVNGRALSSDINITSGDVFAQTTIVENGTNFNNLKNPGIYVQSSNAEVTNNTNMPTKEAFIMTVYMANWKDNSIQVFCNYTGSKMYWRTWQAYGDVWGAWRQVIGSNGGNATINNRLQLTGTQYPQIYGNGTLLQLGVDTNAAVGVVLQGGVFREAGNGSLNLGNGSHRWAVVYAKTGSINTSDRNEKNTIADIDPEQAEKLIMGLKPSTFKFNDGTSGRTHWGLISQDIEELLPQIGMSDLDFAGFIKTPKTEDYYEDVPETVTDEETGEEKTVTRKELKTRTVEGEYVYALRYSEFIAPLICMVQKQQKQIENLERRLSALENKEEAK